MADYVDNSYSSIVKQSSTTDTNTNSLPNKGLIPVHQQKNEDIIDDNTSSHLSDKDDTVCLLATTTASSTKASAARTDAQNQKEKRQLIMATSLCFVFMFAEIAGGYLAGSLAIMSDAAHLLSDCISFIVALLAICLSKKSPDNYMTFGYKRVEVLGAILSIFGIWLLTTFLFYFALNRLLYQDFDIDADAMMIVSAVGIVINIIMAIILHGDGLCCSPHSHQHGSGHSHSPKHEHGATTAYHNNNKPKFEYKPLINESSERRGSKNILRSIPSSFLSASRTNLFDRRSSVCSYRSPTHSRANSFSRTIPFTNADNMIRRNSHAASLSTATAVKINEMIELQRDCIDIDLNDDMKMPVNSVKDSLVMRGCIVDGSAICPVHQYVHRDSSEHTPITSSDSEDLNSYHRHHSHLGHHSNHSHDFSSKNINIQAAVIHVLGDFIQSIGVFISAIIIKYYPNAKIADPLCTFVFSIIVMMTTCTIMKDSIGIILEAVPNSINTDRLAEDLNCIDGVRSIHNLNVWSLTVGWNMMSVHIIIDPFFNSSEILLIATTIAQKGFNIKHCTIQIEKFRENECSGGNGEQNTISTKSSHSIVSGAENSIINILA